MKIITASEARRHFGSLLKSVSRGEEVVVTRRGKSVARVVRERGKQSPDARKAVAGLRELQREIALTPSGQRKMSWDEFKAFVAEGRP